MKRVLAVFVLALLFSSLAFADFRQETKSEKLDINPKQVDFLRVKIVQSGSLDVSGNVNYANMVLYTPQEGVESRSVFFSAEVSWKLVEDNFSNSQLHMEWKSPSGRIDYRVETLVVSRAKHLPSAKPLASAPEYLKENPQIVFTDEMRKIAYPFENSLQKAAELTQWVYNYVNYDLSVVGQLRPSDWVLSNRRGVCVEYANLLSALMKISGIPNRYVVGYAYSSVENKLIGHTWVEVPAADGTWIPFDATWLQGGYLDATHIKTANRMDANQTEVLTYLGSGSVSWTRNEDDIKILDYSLRNTTGISLETTDISFGEAGFLKAGIWSSTCTITEIAALSCVGSDGKELLDIFDEKRQLWHCGAESIYWFFSPADANRNFVYTCPVTVFDQSGAESRAVVRVEGDTRPKAVSISGPGAVSINEEFSLFAEAGASFIFYSPNLTRHSERVWTLSLPKTGAYKFYLYSGGALAAKTVTVLEKKEFSISLSHPQNATLGAPFAVALTVKNLENREKQATAGIELDDRIEQKLVFAPNEAKTLSYNLTAKTTRGRLTAFAASDTLTSYTAFIRVQEKQPDFFDSIGRFFSGVASSIAGFFASLFR